MKKFSWLTWIVFIAVLFFLVPRLSEQEQLVGAIQGGRWSWIVAAFFMTIGWNYGLVVLYRLSYTMVRIRVSLRSLIKLYFASLFFNIITPSFGLAGTTLFIKDVRYRGHSHVKGLLAFALESLWAQIGFVVVVFLLFAFTVVTRQNAGELGWFVLGISSAVVIIQTGLYMIVFKRPKLFERLLDCVSRIGNRISMKFRKRNIFPDGWSTGRVEEMRSIIGFLAENRRGWGKPIVIAVAAAVFQVLVSAFLLVSFGQEVTLPSLIGFLASAVVAGAFFTGPHGVGVVEFGLTLVLSNYGIERGPATLIAIVYRGLTFWLPFFVGFFCFRSLDMFEGRKRDEMLGQR